MSGTWEHGDESQEIVPADGRDDEWQEGTRAWPEGDCANEGGLDRRDGVGAPSAVYDPVASIWKRVNELATARATRSR